MSLNINTASNNRNKKKFEKFINYTGARDKHKEREINQLNMNKEFFNNTDKKKYQYEYSNVKDNEVNINLIKNDEEEKNILLGLVKEGLISLDELSENEIKGDEKYDINNIQIKDINMEKIIRKILFLNKSLKDTKLEKIKLENEQNTFSNAINESRTNTSGRDNKDNNNNYIYNDKYNNYNRKSKDILNKYEDDLMFFSELINENNNCDEFK